MFLCNFATIIDSFFNSFTDLFRVFIFLYLFIVTFRAAASVCGFSNSFDRIRIDRTLVPPYDHSGIVEREID
jgi:hypothetical protein